MPKADELLKKFSSLKTLPHVAIKLTKMISDDNCSMAEFDEVIRLDPTLVVRILKLVNSSYYSLQQKVKSVSDALVYIGMENLRNMVVVEALKDIFTSKADEEYFSRKRLWLHCAAVSICSQMIAERIFGLKGEDAFLCGILHDIGIIVEDQTVPDLFAAACQAWKPAAGVLPNVENEKIGTDHCKIGSLLARDWKFPKDVQEGIRLHHKDMNSMDPASVTGIIQTAEYLVARMEYTVLPNMQGLLSAPLRTHIHGRIVDYKALTQDLPDEMQKAKELYELNS